MLQQQPSTPAPTSLGTQRQSDTGDTPHLGTSSEVTGEEQKSEESLSPKFAMLARKEKALRGKYQELKAKEEALKAKEQEYQSSYVPKSSLAERIRQDPLGALEELGMSADQLPEWYDRLTQAVLNGKSADDPAYRKLHGEIQTLKQQQLEAEKRREEQQSKAYEQAVSQIRNEAKILVDSSPDFETIKEAGQVEAVVELIRETFDETGQLLSVEEAAREVEDYLIEEAYRMAQFRKVKSKLSPQEPLDKAESLSEKKSQGIQITPSKQLQKEREVPALKTLTHAHSASTPTRMTEKERRDRAVKAFLGQL